MSRKDIEIMDTKERIFSRDDYQCQFQGCKVRGTEKLQLAHRISQDAQGREWVRKSVQLLFCEDISEGMIDRIIHHPFNMSASCSVHNDSFNIGCSPEERKALLVEIWLNIMNENGAD